MYDLSIKKTVEATPPNSDESGFLDAAGQPHQEYSLVFQTSET